MQKRLNRSICRLGCGLHRAEGSTSSTVYARWCHVPRFGGHIGATGEYVRLRRRCGPMSNYFDQLLLLLHCVSKNVPPLTCYNLDIHSPIAIIFGRGVTEKVRNETMLCFFHLTCLLLQHYLGKEETHKTAHWCFVRATKSDYCNALDFLSPEPCPNSPKLNALITRFRKSYSSVIMSRESKRLKKSSSNLLNSGNAPIQRVKNTIFVFPIFPGSAEAHVRPISGGVVKCLLIAYFIGSISAKNIKIHSRVKIIASQRWDVF